MDQACERQISGRAASELYAMPVSAYFKLEGFEFTTNGGTPRTFSSSALLGQKNVDTRWTQAADAFRASV